MGNSSTKGFLGVFLFMILLNNAVQSQELPKSVVIIKGIRTAYVPFSAIGKPVFEITNGKLNISVTDRNNNMLQVNGIDMKQLSSGVKPSSAFQTVIIMSKGGTNTDDGDTNPGSLIEIKCTDNKQGTPITVGIKTTILQDGKKLRVYATLHGIIPSPQYQRSN